MSGHLHDKLFDLIDELEGKPVEWGVNDCTMFAARWFERVHGCALDLAPYDSEATARALIAEAGTLADLWTAALDGHLPEQYGEPEFGDVGVIESRLFGQVGGVFGDDGVFFWRAEKGTALLRPRPKTIVKVWAIC